MPRLRWIVLTTLPTLLLALGCGRGGAAATPAAETKRLRVVVARPERRYMVRRTKLPGDVEGLERAALHARAAGFVREVRVDVGDPVRKGQVLAVVEAPDLEARRAQARAAVDASESEATAAETALPRARALLEEAKVELERARAERGLRDVTLERLRNLLKEGGVTQQDADEAEAKAVLARAGERAAEARIETAKATVTAAGATARSARSRVETARGALGEVEAQVSFTEVKAPFDGVVVERRADPGAFVPPPSSSATTPLLLVARTDVVRVWIDVPERDARFVSVGRAVLVERTGASGPPIEAKVSRFAGALDSATRTLRVAVDVLNPEVEGGDGPRALLPGNWVHVRLDLETRKGALVVPAEALVVRRGKSYVFVVEGEKARRKKVETGADDGERVEVVSGIAPEALVVVEGKSAVTDGADVALVERGAGKP